MSEFYGEAQYIILSIELDLEAVIITTSSGLKWFSFSVKLWGASDWIYVLALMSGFWNKMIKDF